MTEHDAPPEKAAPELQYKVAKHLRVVKRGDRLAQLFIDGEYSPWATIDGFTVHPQRGQMPAVAVSIAAEHVQVDDAL